MERPRQESPKRTSSLADEREHKHHRSLVYEPVYGDDEEIQRIIDSARLRMEVDILEVKYKYDKMLTSLESQKKKRDGKRLWTVKELPDEEGKNHRLFTYMNCSGTVIQEYVDSEEGKANGRRLYGIRSSCLTVPDREITKIGPKKALDDAIMDQEVAADIHYAALEKEYTDWRVGNMHFKRVRLAYGRFKNAHLELVEHLKSMPLPEYDENFEELVVSGKEKIYDEWKPIYTELSDEEIGYFSQEAAKRQVIHSYTEYFHRLYPNDPIWDEHPCFTNKIC